MDDLTIKGNVIDALMTVTDPHTDKNVVDAHLLDAVDVAEGVVDLKLRFPADYPRDQRVGLEDTVADAIEAVEGVKDLSIHIFSDGASPYEGAAVDAPAAASAAGKAPAAGDAPPKG